MSNSRWNSPEPKEAWRWNRTRIAQWQVAQFNQQLDVILPHNRFYARKLTEAGIPLDARIRSLDELTQWPLTTKQDLVDSISQSSDRISLHHTFAAGEYSRFHRTSGTKGGPLMILDTLEDWRWWSDCWQHVLTAAEVTARDRVFLAFSFGPFIGFWSAHQASIDRGAMVIPAGGLNTLARLEFMRQSAATVICCTPSYALHLAEVAESERFPLGALPVTRLIVAGETGGSVSTVRHRIESIWEAQVIDHAGATEIGAWGFGWQDRIGLHVIETSFIAEVLPLADDNTGELVFTSLGRYGAPLIRYRTGDVVSFSTTSLDTDHLTNFLWLPGGLIGRVDDMVTVRGVNVFPSNIESIVRQLPEIVEYQVHINRHRALDELKVTIEAPAATQEKLEKLLMVQLGLRCLVQCVPPGTLPRTENKSQRWIVQPSGR